ncbi:unnamed protein product [Coffea canephora]|uniref:Hydroxyacylglutathione hydrolase C-terminal domain-containing protein n=1 Tax=Coffea canephora TaxID=49390 RepID=A0A068V1V6_COFCA|nr:unnamed protein product [Coffea canephora]
MKNSELEKKKNVHFVVAGNLCEDMAVLIKKDKKRKNYLREFEPDNANIRQKLIWARHQRLLGLATVPSTIEEEWETNPFMPVDIPEIQSSFLVVGRKSAVEALREIRQRKDNWEA